MYDAALERPESQRGAFVEEACGGDTALRDEVESLWAEGGHGASIIESPALEVAATITEEQRRGLRTAPRCLTGTVARSYGLVDQGP
jgi:hypothetical protein